MPPIVTPENAFAPVEGEVSIPIDYKQHDFRFTRNWFRNRNQLSWSVFLKPQFGDGRPVRMLQIGVFEGMDLVWCCQNLLTHPESYAIAIDPWLETTKLSQSHMGDVELRARHNLKPWDDKVEIIKGFSDNILADHDFNAFDLVVVDGDHTKNAVIADGIHAIRLTEPGAIIVFDDVRNRVYKDDHVQQGLDTLLNSSDGEHLELAWRHRYCDAFKRI